MKIATKMVIVRASGHKCLINESDFDPAIHDEVGAKPAKVAEPEQKEDTKEIEAKAVVPDKQPPPEAESRPRGRGRRGAK